MSRKLKDLPIGAKVKYPDAKYNGKPITFLIGAQNHSGYPANSTSLISEKILSIKAFDAREPNSGNSNRRSYGNNRYRHSNIRQWMNKEGKSWYSNQHDSDQAPNSGNVTYNPYNQESGFLSNFPKEFVDALLPTNLTVVKSSTDGGGTESVADKMFLLSTTEVGLANESGTAEGRKWPLFDNNASRQANPTAEAVNESEYKHDNLHPDKPRFWWLRTPYAGSANYVRSVLSSGTLSYSLAYFGYYGFRPALNFGSEITVSDAPDSDGAYILEFNEAPKISGPSTSIGNKTGPFSVTVQITDKENDTVDVVEKLNGVEIRSEKNISQGVDREIEITSELWTSIPLNEKSELEIEATDSNGNRSSRVYTFTKSNSEPSANAVEPTGDLSEIGIVDTTMPIFVWSFNDPDPGDRQSAYQFIIENLQGDIVHDSGKKQSTQSFYQLPESAKLNWADRYKWKVRVWDKYDVPSDYTFQEFFMPNRPPSVGNVRPGSTDAENPEGASLTPTFKWDFEDLDEEAQSAFQLVLKEVDGDAEIYNTNKVNRSVNEHTIPDFVLSHGKSYCVQVTVWDPNGLSDTSEKTYIVTNATPTAPLLTTPINNYRTTLKPTFSGIVGTDEEDDGMHFIIQISQDKDFKGEVLEYRSDEKRDGWKVNGYDVPEEGVFNDQSGQTVSYEVQVQLDMNKKYYWRMAAIDASTKAVGKYGEVRHIRAGNELKYDTMAHPIDTGSAAANRVLVALDYLLASDGSNPADIKVFICNNANDVDPTWEDMTEAFGSMDYHTFDNDEKTAETFAVALKVEITANDTMGDIFVNSHGFTFD